MVAFIARHGKVAYAQPIGYMDVANKTPMRTDGVFRIYSMTKPVIAVAILQLAEHGKLRLDDPLAKFIPAFATTNVYAGGGAMTPTLQAAPRPITIEHLLTHTSGLTYGFFGQTPVDSIYRRANLLDITRTVRQVADSLSHLPLVFAPGDAWNYSMAIDVLGAVIEVASGQPLDRYLELNIFAPLGMRETAFRVMPSMDGESRCSIHAAGTGASSRTRSCCRLAICRPHDSSAAVVACFDTSGLFAFRTDASQRRGARRPTYRQSGKRRGLDAQSSSREADADPLADGRPRGVWLRSRWCRARRLCGGWIAGLSGDLPMVGFDGDVLLDRSEIGFDRNGVDAVQYRARLSDEQDFQRLVYAAVPR